MSRHTTSRRARLGQVVVLLLAGMGAASCGGDDTTLPLEADPTTVPTAPAGPAAAPDIPPDASPDELAPDASPDELAVTAGRRFLDTYVAPHGRVQRHDQGGDTVSEGQAYAMLIAAAVDDEDTFAAVWSWTRDHLLRPDGLLAWRWHGGEVVDWQSAADADLDAVHALLLAADRFDRPEYRDDARALADAAYEHLTLPLDAGRLLLAGPWAADDRRWNPSYLSPLAYSLLFRMADDQRWAEVAATSRVIVDRLTADPPHLAPDWARLADDGPAPHGDPPVSGYDAARVPLRFALDCDPHGVELAARPWPVLSALTENGTAPPPAVLHLDGTPAAGAGHPAATVGAAASAHAAGDEEAAARLLDLAEVQDGDAPSYYGAALVALARLGLDTDRLGSCP